MPTPELTPNQTPERTPYTTPEITPEVTPYTTPEITITPTPEATPTNSTPNETSSNITTTPSQADNQEPDVILSSNTDLKSLRLDVATISPDFESSILNYEAIVNEKINNIDVLAAPKDGSSSIEITGNNDLKMGLNLIQVTVVAQNGEKKTYNINVNRTNEANELNSYLENLTIENVFLIPEFRFDVFSYKVELASTQDKINILAVPQIEGATVSIQGNENIDFGRNNIVVMVTSKNEKSTSVYTIEVYRNTLDEELAKAEKNEIDSEKALDENIKKLSETEKNDNTILWIVIVILIVGGIGLIVYTVWK